MICIYLLNLSDVKWWSKFLPNVPSWPGNCSCPSAKVTSLIPRDASRGPWGHPLATQGRPTRSYPKRGSPSYESHDLWKVWDDNTKNWVKNTIPKRWMAEYQTLKDEYGWLLSYVNWLFPILQKPQKRGQQRQHVTVESSRVFRAAIAIFLPEKRQAVKGRGGGDVSYGSPFDQSEIIGSSI